MAFFFKPHTKKLRKQCATQNVLWKKKAKYVANVK